jgi:hypothetical protein
MFNIESATGAGSQLGALLNPKHLIIQPEANDWVGKIVDIMKEQFSLKPKEQIGEYRCSYLEWFNRVSLPPQYRVPDLMEFSDTDNVSTFEHVGRYLTQCGEISTHDPMTIRLFSLSLSRWTLACFTSLPPNSFNEWLDLGKIHS